MSLFSAITARRAGILATMLLPTLAFAQTIIEPPAAPPGGNSASWITTGLISERKLGSLMIGSSGTAKKLCLNADTTESLDCIDSWSDIIGLVGGPFVARRTTGLTPSDQSDPTTYFSMPPANSEDIGAVSIQATGDDQAISLIAEANYVGSAAYGLFAGDGGNPANYAAYFDGRVGVERTVFANGSPGPVGELCLNSTANYNSSTNRTAGCITAWGDLTGTIQGNVSLQSANPPIPDDGTAGLTGVANFGSAIIGPAPGGLAALTFCGDGMCNAGETSTAGANYCPIDCVAPLRPTQLLFYSGTETTIRLLIRGQTQQPAGSYQLLLARSSNPAFISDPQSLFSPQHGVSYTGGTVVNGVTIVDARTTSSTTSQTIVDTNLATTTSYYYRLYQANLFPVYNLSPLTVTGTTSPDCPDSLPENAVCTGTEP